MSIFSRKKDKNNIKTEEQKTLPVSQSEKESSWFSKKDNKVEDKKELSQPSEKESSWFSKKDKSKKTKEVSSDVVANSSLAEKEASWFSTPSVSDAKQVKGKDGKIKEKSDNKFIATTHKVMDPVVTSMQKAGNYTVKQFEKTSETLRKRPLIGKVTITVVLILIFRIAASITTPGVIVNSQFGGEASSFIGIMDMMGGGALKNFSIVALGISPYITASIIMQLLQTEAFPPIYRMAHSGPKGKRKVNVITRCVTLVFAVITAITLLQQFSSGANLISLKPEFDNGLYKYFVLPVILIAGSMFTLFLGEEITNKGVGNGTSLIIFSGIVAELPGTFKLAYNELVGGESGNSAFVGVMNFIIYTAVFLALLFFIGFMYKAERHIPIQQTGAGMTTDTKQMSRLPIKLNPGGVMPMIFALMIISLPLQIAQFFDHQNETRIWIEANMKFTDPIGLSLMAVLIMLFSIAMSYVTFNPMTVADNFKKNGTFIPGIKPGNETEKYLSRVILRLSIFSGFYLFFITSLQYFEQMIGLSPQITYGGTTMIIIVTAAIETIGQVKARNTTNKIQKQRLDTASQSGENGGLLW